MTSGTSSQTWPQTLWVWLHRNGDRQVTEGKPEAIESREYRRVAGDRTPDYEELYHQAMDALRGTKMQHGSCKPVERNACTHCMCQRRLDKMLAEYKGRRIVIS